MVCGLFAAAPCTQTGCLGLFVVKLFRLGAADASPETKSFDDVSGEHLETVLELTVLDADMMTCLKSR